MKKRAFEKRERGFFIAAGILLGSLLLGLAVLTLVSETNNNLIKKEIMLPVTSQETGDVRVAFIGDQGLTEDAKEVLELIKEEGTDIVLHQGDFDYKDDPDSWDQQINKILGEDFPYFASIGNHDVVRWDDYQKKLKRRLENIEGASCTGDLGVQSTCTYKEIFFILSGIGTKGTNHVDFINEELGKTNATWKICSWHKNHNLMQVGNKNPEVPLAAYDACRRGGAIVVSGHDHSYSRTHLISDFENQIVASREYPLEITNGKTIAVVSGLGGLSAYDQVDSLAAKEWWAVVYTKQQDAEFGALFCTFYNKEQKSLASCYFKTISGKIIDRFDLVRVL